MEYSIAFSVNAISFCSAVQLNGWLAARFGLARLIQPAVLGYAAVMLLVLALVGWATHVKAAPPRQALRGSAGALVAGPGTRAGGALKLASGASATDIDPGRSDVHPWSTPSTTADRDRSPASR